MTDLSLLHLLFTLDYGTRHSVRDGSRYVEPSISVLKIDAEVEVSTEPEIHPFFNVFYI